MTSQMFEEPKLRKDIRVRCAHIKKAAYENKNGKKVSAVVCENVVILQRSIDPEWYSGTCNDCGYLKSIKFPNQET